MEMMGHEVIAIAMIGATQTLNPQVVGLRFWSGR